MLVKPDLLTEKLMYRMQDEDDFPETFKSIRQTTNLQALEIKNTFSNTDIALDLYEVPSKQQKTSDLQIKICNTSSKLLKMIYIKFQYNNNFSVTDKAESTSVSSLLPFREWTWTKVRLY